MTTRTTWGNPYDHSEYSRTTWTAATWRQGYARGAKAEFSCDWCGSTKTCLYRYDGDEAHKFCNKECKECYR